MKVQWGKWANGRSNEAGEVIGLGHLRVIVKGIYLFLLLVVMYMGKIIEYLFIGQIRFPTEL